MARNDKKPTSSIPVASESNPLRLPARATVPMPRELVPLSARADATVVSGERRAKRERSAYVATLHPAGERLKRQGQLALVVARLKRLRAQVLAGLTLNEALVDGQMDSWHARGPLDIAARKTALLWDDEDRPRHTLAERVALVDKALGLLGAVRRGGWFVAGVSR